MQSKFFKPKNIKKAIELSPYFVLQTICGIKLLYDNEKDHDKDPKASEKYVLRLFMAARFILPSLKRMNINYQDYQTASKLLEKYGYRTKWTEWFMDSTCGRQQLKMACKEQGYLERYQQQLRDDKIKWYHIDGKRSLRAGFVFEGGVLMPGAVALSHNAVVSEPPEEVSQPKPR